MKKRKLAHIVPVSHLVQTENNQYHMCLAHLVLENNQYAEFYRRMVAEGKYVLMDNGAAENAQLDLAGMVRAIDYVKPHEIILSDVLSDGDSTYKTSLEALQYYRARGITTRFMVVPQGKTLVDWKKSATQLMDLGVNSFGISKFLTITTGDKLVRYPAALHLEELFKKTGKTLEVHLLGCDTGPLETKMIFDRFDFVRGCDTALAYLFAQADLEMELLSSRPAGEIDFIDGQVAAQALDTAMESFDSLSGVNNGLHESWRN